MLYKSWEDSFVDGCFVWLFDWKADYTLTDKSIDTGSNM